MIAKRNIIDHQSNKSDNKLSQMAKIVIKRVPQETHLKMKNSTAKKQQHHSSIIQIPNIPLALNKSPKKT